MLAVRLEGLSVGANDVFAPADKGARSRGPFIISTNRYEGK